MNPLISNTFKRVAIASFEFEGNDFSLKVNNRKHFIPYAVGDAMWSHIDGHRLAVTGASEVLRAIDGIELVPILIAQSQSGAKVEDAFYRETFSLLIEGIRSAGKLDGLYLALHGAMVSGGVRDAEGDILAALRGVVGPDVPIAASLDLHAHVSTRMLEMADILVGYANYPHDDAYETGRRSATLLRDTLAGTLRPVMRMQRVSMIVPVTGSSTQSPDAPLAKVRALARSLESDGVVSTSYFTVQPWLDDDNATNVALAITHDDATLAKNTAHRIAQTMWALREEFELPLYTVPQAIALAEKTCIKPVIVADQADCVGAGSSGDAAAVLEQVLKQASHLKVAISLVDSMVAMQAHEQGIGAVFSTTIGFRNDSRYGSPIPIRAEVLSLHSGEFSYNGGPFGGVEVSMGQSAVLKAGQVHVLVVSRPTYEYAGEQYAAAGMNIADYDIVVFKNTMNFRTNLKSGGTWVLLEGVGSSSANLVALPWANRSSAFWPRERELSNPFGN